MSPETAIFTQITEAIEAAGPGDTLAGVRVYETVYEPIDQARGIRIGDSVGDLGPRAGSVKEFNIRVPVQCFARVDGKDTLTAREAVRDLAIAAAKVIFDDSSLGGRVCEAVIIGNGRRGWARVSTTNYAVQVFTVLVDSFGFTGEV